MKKIEQRDDGLATNLKGTNPILGFNSIKFTERNGSLLRRKEYKTASAIKRGRDPTKRLQRGRAGDLPAPVWNLSHPAAIPKRFALVGPW